MTPPTLIVIDVQRALDDPGYGDRNNPEAEANIAGFETPSRPTRRSPERSAASGA
jgi:hypothetical protein